MTTWWEPTHTREGPLPAFAHTLPDHSPDDWQALEDHLEAVARRAASFASAFQGGDVARIAGLWHDIGKFSEAFQSYLAAAGSPDTHEAELVGRVDHSSAGAQRAAEAFPISGQLLAYVIAGHHAGLADATGGASSLSGRLQKTIHPYEPSAEIADLGPPALPDFVRAALHAATRDPFVVAFFTRMIFSCLVDSDFLDTEAFMSPDRASKRPEWPEDVLGQMDEALKVRLAELSDDTTEVNQLRGSVLSDAIAAGAKAPGVFTFTVPTGGGKTLSSMAFALRHARAHGLRRVVYVCPFTSIIEQNAEVFRLAFRTLTHAGPDPVVEHHSNVDPDGQGFSARLVTENWDAPVIVTTGVQFYESLFASRASRCRKLHNLSRSVIILDEAQSLPVDYLEPCLRALRELTANYGASVVLCTATQPAITHSSEFPIGLASDEAREIVSDPGVLFHALRRVEVETLPDPPGDEELARRMSAEPQVLCIVNTRHHALTLFESLDDEEAFHLSALMCPAHRSEVLKTVSQRLQDDAPCRLVSTRLIEAGVDIDFPVVFRSMAGLDSIAQAAGRCNRNGRLAAGRVIVFESDHQNRERFMRETADVARQVLDLHEECLRPEAIEHYFRLYYWRQKNRWDRKQILDSFAFDLTKRQTPFHFQFRSAARAMRLIEDGGEPVIIPWQTEGRRLVDELRRSFPGPSATLLRKLQRYTVQVPPSVRTQLLTRGLEFVHDEYPVLALVDGNYDARTGLRQRAESMPLLST